MLRSASNLAAGGDSIDVTEEAHPASSIRDQSSSCNPGRGVRGTDLIAPDITVPPTATNHIVSEIEYSPCPTVAHFPLIGTPRDMAGPCSRCTWVTRPGHGLGDIRAADSILEVIGVVEGMRGLWPELALSS